MAKKPQLSLKKAQDTDRNAAEELGKVLGQYLKDHPSVQGLFILGQTDGKIAPPQYILTCIQNDAHGHEVSISLATDWLGAGIEWTRSMARELAAKRAAKSAGKEATAEAPAAIQ